METLINKEPKTPFEKLLFAQKYIEVLKKEIEILKGVISEEKIEKGKLQAELYEAEDKLENYFSNIEKANFKKKYEYQVQHQVKLEKKIQGLKKQLEDYKTENLKLNMKLNTLKNENRHD